MLKSVKATVLIFAAFWMLSGCQALTGRTLGQNIDDNYLTGAVKTQLVRDKAANFTRIDVDTNDGIVYLNGTVDSAEQRTRAEQIARNVGGVRDVVNNLQLARGR
jgi:hyperosmotically inducible periplasmic protein